MFFEDYTKTGYVYHIAPINDLEKILNKGIRYDDKITYKKKYIDFHQFIDQGKTTSIPIWVRREEAIFASMNYRDDPGFHSHTVVMAVKIDPSKCWIANESRANQIYEPFILKNVEGFKDAKSYIENKGVEFIKKYWTTSISFQDNLKQRWDLNQDYDAEVLIFHSIPPKNIKILFIVSDHKILTLSQWLSIFRK